MLASSIPTKFQIPFANSAPTTNINAIPQASQIGTTIGAASLTDGFPPVTLQPVGAGGVPPWGRDFNGLLNQITAWTRWQNAGGTVKFDSTFQTGIGGYPQGAVVASTVTLGLFWLSLVDNNTTNPDTGGAGWYAWSSTVVVGDTRSLTGVCNGSGVTASWTISEIIAKTALGGAAFLGSNLSLTFNGATTGSGGMDTGSVPGTVNGTAPGYLSIYAIYNQTTGWNTLGTVAGSGLTYNGSAMPTGFIASTLLWAGLSGGTAWAGTGFGSSGSVSLAAFGQVDRKIYVGIPNLKNIQIPDAGSSPYSVLNGSTAGNFVALSLTPAIPPSARFCDGFVAGPVQGLVLAGGTVGGLATNGIGTFAFGASSSTTITVPFYGLPILTNQTLYYATAAANPFGSSNINTGGGGTIWINAYTI
jgi:hypothetical protein